MYRNRHMFVKVNIKRIAAAVLCLSFVFAAMRPMTIYGAEAAADKSISIKKAYQYALTKSEELKKIEYSIMTQEAKYSSAVKSLELKRKNRSTLRWSPLLSFKWPTEPDLMDSYDEMFKPDEYNIKIDDLKHQYTDEKLNIYQTVNDYFLRIVTLETKIDFDENRVKNLETTLAKNKARQLMGEANPKDIKAMESKLRSLNNELMQYRRELMNEKKGLSKFIGVDVVDNYSFENPYIDAEIQRESLDYLIKETLDKDQSLYEARGAATLAYKSLNYYWDLISSKYSSSQVGIISKYVQSARNGQEFSATDFRKAYDKFLKEIDKKWEGDYKIKLIFFTIRFAKERLKGELDGSRYMEDNPYCLLDAASEYKTATKERDNLVETLTRQVESTYDQYVNMRNAYLTNLQLVEDSKEALSKEQVLNRLGELTYEELASTQDSYEELEIQLVESLSDYSNILTSFDRLTCGAITSLLEGTSTDMVAIGDGLSYISEDIKKGAYYYLESIVVDEAFSLSVSIPDDFDVSVTDFALICDGIQIGPKTPVTEKLMHLALAKTKIDYARIRFYDGDNIVCDCDIDPDANSGPLNIIKDIQVYDVDPADICSYTTERDEETGIVTIFLGNVSDYDPDAKYYMIYDSTGTALGLSPEETVTYKDVEAAFIYPDPIATSMDELTIKFYSDSDGTYLYSGYFTEDKVKKSDE